MEFFIVDAFTEQPFGGNTAGVVLLEPGAAFPDDEWMRLLAAELRYSETAFVRFDGPAEFTVRYFTPAGEIDLCGHATIASFGVLYREGFVPEGTCCLNHTRAGDLEVAVGPQVMMQMASPRLEADFSEPSLLGELLRVMGVKPEQLGEWPPETFSTGLPDIILPLRDVAALQALRPDMAALTALSERLDVVGVHAFAIDPDDGFTAHVRNFAPRYGIPEESATGTANAALTGYLYHHRLIGDGAQCFFLQGEAMGRPSLIQTTLTLKNRVPDIRVGGTCAIVAKGTL
ncbi:MAG: PhzF family phenazine biosynthesis protein [Bacteroidales bacterium]|nr:PhzF family phenazine biosynthesis protein [Bacteroidales bacterium]